MPVCDMLRQPWILMHCPPMRKMWGRDGHYEQMKEVPRIWVQHYLQPMLMSSIAGSGHCKQC